MKNKDYLLCGLMKTKTYTYFFLPTYKKQLFNLSFFYPLSQTYKNNTFCPPQFYLAVKRERLSSFYRGETIAQKKLNYFFQVQSAEN